MSVLLLLLLLYREIRSPADATSLQKDLDALCAWEQKWQMKFNFDKCFVLVMHMTTKKTPASFTYSLNNTPLQKTTSHPYLGIVPNSKCTWSSHINKNHYYRKANTWCHSPKLQALQSRGKIPTVPVLSPPQTGLWCFRLVSIHRS